MKKIFLIMILFTFYQSSFAGWIYQNSGTNLSLNDIYFVNSSIGYAVGDSAIIIKTTNGGADWFTVKQQTYGALFSLKFLNELTGWAVGGKETGYMHQVWSQAYYTTDGGSTWLSPFSPYFFGWKFTNIELLSLDYIWLTAGYGYEGFSEGTIIKSTNRGQNWVIVNNPGGYYPGFSWVSSQTAWAVTNFWKSILPTICMVVKTNNYGQDWDTIYTEIDTTIGIHLYFTDIQFVDLNTGYLLKNTNWNDWNSQLYKSTNGGYNWVTIDSTTHWYRDLFFLNNNTGWLTGCNSDHEIIMKTTDGGFNWEQQFCGSIGTVKKIFFLNSSNGWALSGSTILHTTNGGTFINTLSNKLPKQFELHQNYPNPFNPNTKIKFQISKLSDVKLVVYDLLGRKVATLVNERLKAGSYEVDFEGSKLPSGVYFYSLLSETFKETKRMVLMK